ncbi:Chromosome partition protein Smc [Carpediemonas membranifera]|uniref:Chromosome partition protein Smc n=1 Tax=Carpediemonas membranifera TaxID=201153 RepID=A0A8J6AVQ3_9EUKA|nr:Chromosome partition protein Smc [Carpediemonas membranifera]|eukprot:KAG9395383.1 Chromosome partition protein Smc [Carpediemonas membranifera]
MCSLCRNSFEMTAEDNLVSEMDSLRQEYLRRYKKQANTFQDMKTERDMFEQEKISLEQRISQLNRDHKREISELQRLVDRTNRQSAVNDQTLRSKDTELKKLQTTLKNLEADTHEREVSQEKLLATAQAKVRSMEDQLAARSNDIRSRDTRIAELVKENGTIRKQQTAALAKAQKQFEAEMREKTATMDRLQSTLDESRAEINRMSKQLSDALDERSSLQAELADDQTQSALADAAHRDQLSQLRAELADEQGRSKIATDRATHADEELHRVREELDSFRERSIADTMALEETNEGLQKELRSSRSLLESTTRQFETQVAQLRATIAEHEMEIERLSDEHRTNGAQYEERLLDEQQAHAEAYEQLKLEYEEKTSQLNDTLHQLDVTQSTLSDLRVDLDSRDREVSRMQTEIEEMASEHAVREDQAASEREELTNRVAALELDLASYQDRVQAAEDARGSASDNMARLHAELESTQRQVQTLKTMIQALKDTHAIQTEDLEEEHRMELGTAQRKADQLANEAADLKARNEDLATQVELLTSQRNELQDTLTDAELNNATLSTEKEDLVDELEREKAQWRRTLETTATEHAVELEEAHSETSRVRLEKDQAEDDRARAEARAAEVEEELTQAIAQAEEAEHTADEKLAWAQAELSDASSRIAQLTEALEMAERQAETAEAQRKADQARMEARAAEERAGFNKQADGRAAKVETLTKQLSAAKRDARDAETRAASLADELKSAREQLSRLEAEHKEQCRRTEADSKALHRELDESWELFKEEQTGRATDKANLTAEMDALRRRAEVAEESHAMVQAQLEDDAAQHAHQLQLEQDERNALHGDIEALEAELKATKEDAQAEKDKLMSESARLSQRIAELEGEVDSLSKEAESLSKTLAQAQQSGRDTQASLDEEIESLNKTVKSLKADVVERDSTITDLQELTADHEQLLADHEELQTRYDDLLREHMDQTRELDDTRAEQDEDRREGSTKVSELQGEIDALKRQLGDAKAANQTLAQTSETDSRELDRKLQEERSGRRQDSLRFQQELRVLQSSVATEKRALESQYSTTMGQNDARLQSKLRAAEAELESTRRMQTAQQQRVAGVEGRLTTLRQYTARLRHILERQGLAHLVPPEPAASTLTEFTSVRAASRGRDGALSSSTLSRTRDLTSTSFREAQRDSQTGYRAREHEASRPSGLTRSAVSHSRMTSRDLSPALGSRTPGYL